MRRVGVLIVILALLTFSTVNPSMSSIPAAIVDEAQEAPFLTAADGDVSSESIGEAYSHKFRETTDDDVLHFPDTIANDTEYTASSGDSGDDYHGGGGDIAQTYTQNSIVWSNRTTEGVGWVRLNFTFDGLDGAVIDGWSWGLYVYHQVGDEFSNYSIYNWVTDSWDYQGNLPDANNKAWTNGSTCNSDYWSGNECAILAESEDLDAGEAGMVYVDCGVVKFDYMTLASNGYAESFADVNDWTSSGFSGDDSFSTDGDVLTFISDYSGGWDYDYVYADIPDISSPAGLYFEINHQINETAGGLRVLFSDSDSSLSNYQTIYLSEPTSYSTHKFILTYGYTLRSVWLGTETGTAVDKCYQVDYLRIGKSTEMGWQHDCSTNEAVTGYNSPTISSDGDILNITGSHAVEGGIYISLDTTATTAYIDTDYYPFIEIRSKYGNGGAFRVRTTDEGGNHFYYLDDSGSWTSNRINLKADSDEIRALLIYDNVDNSQQFEIEYIQLYSIANFTLYFQSGYVTSDYAYVDSGTLHISKSTTRYIKLGHDPALGVTIATHNVWNYTSSDINPTASTDINVQFYADGAWGGLTADESRGALSGTTLTDIQFFVYSSMDVSAIKFIEDSNAPDILDKFVNPVDPNDDEAVSFTAVTYDTIEVYKVTLNAVVYPDGFSDVDYEMTEQTTDVLWSYEFSTLVAGYYLFGVTANDGANTYSEYIPVTVRESAIVVEEITLIGAGSDFTMMQFSARINKDCSYVIYEESENNAESATHSGSVSEPSFNLAWNKLDTTDTNVNFTIRFTNGTLTYNYTSQYQVAQTALAITGDESLSQDEIVFSGTSTKACSWTLYLDSVQEDTGSIATAGSFVVNWTRTQSITPASISFAIKFYTATETVWENGTYSEYSLTAFSIQTLFMDLTDPSISAIFTTSWGNATGYLYEDDVQQDTAAEGITLSYSKATTAGTYSVALKIDAGGEIAWYNTTYTVAVTTLQVTDDSIRTTANYAYLDGHVNLNANYTVYEETVQVGTGSVSAGSFEIRWTKASSSVENVTVLFESDSQTYPVYTGYDVAEQATFVVESWWMDLNLGVESYVEFYVLSSYENATVYVYDNNTLMTTVTESAGGAYSYFWLSESEGLHTITLNITHGATVHTRTRTYYIPNWAATGLVFRLDLWTFQDNYTMMELESNWMNCTYYVYLNGSLVATSANDPVILNFTRAINIGEYNLTIFADGGTQTYTQKNIRYIITEEGVTYDFSTVSGGRSVREGDIIEGDTYEGDDVVINENPPGIYMTAETAATIAVSTVFIFFLAVLFTNSRVKKAQLDIDKKGNQ